MVTPPRVRMFAGPNGSGKSTIRALLGPQLLGVYVNPDEIQLALETTGRLEFAEYEVTANRDEVVAFFETSPLAKRAGLQEMPPEISVAGNSLSAPSDHINAYLASLMADYIRRKLLEARTSFTFETVMSSSDKIDFLKIARAAGYRTYLYYIATEDPAINVSRVRNRVLLGGHPVPEDKIVSRYSRSLNLLLDAIRQTDRAYLFDNSSSSQRWIAEITNGRTLELRVDQIPAWFQQSVLEKVRPVDLPPQ